MPKGKFSMVCCWIFILIANASYAQQPKLMLPIGHTDFVTSVEFSPDGKQIVTASFDKSAKLWDVASRMLLASFDGHSGRVNSAKFSSDGKKIVTGSSDSSVKIWDVESGKLLASLKIQNAPVTYADFSPDGKNIAIVTNNNITSVWDAISGTLKFSITSHSNGSWSVQFSPDSKKIVVAASDKTAKIYEANSGKLLVNLEGHSSLVNAVQYSRDGKKIVTAAGDGSGIIWDAYSGKILTSIVDRKDLVAQARISADGTKIVTITAKHTAKVWDAISGNLQATLVGHTNWVNFAKFTPDGNKVLTSSYDKTTKMWDTYTGKLLLSLKDSKDLLSNSQLSPDGKMIATSSFGTEVEVWDGVSGKLLGILAGHSSIVSSAQCSMDGNRIVTSSNDSSAKIWNAITGKLLFCLKSHNNSVNSAQFSRDGAKVVTSSDDSTAKVWDVISSKLLFTLKGHKGGVVNAYFSMDGTKIVTASHDSTAKVWDVQSGNLVITLFNHGGWVSSAQFSPDGNKVITASYHDNTARIWEGKSGILLYSLIGHTSAVTSVHYSEDGKKILTSSFDSTAKVWDAASGKLLVSINDNSEMIWSSQFSPDGKRIVNTTFDKVAKVWDAENGKLLFKLEGHSGWIRTADYSPDGKKIVTASGDNTARIWDAATGQLLYAFFTIDNDQYLIFDKDSHYDGTEAARKLLYFTCGTEIIELDQVKDQLWVPNLAERINNGETINAKTLYELNICGLTPEVEEAIGKADEYYFKIKPRRGGLGETILSVNGNQTKVYKPEQLLKKDGFYELIIKKDDLSSYFIAGAENNITVKAFTADNNISSRGAKMGEDKTKEKAAAPNLYAVIVGVSDYKGTELDLRYADKDATDISNTISNAAKKLLNANGGEHVFMYNLTTAKEHYLLPEKNGIKKVFEEIAKKARANDILLIFFAGHGVMAGEGDKKQFYFLSADASTLASTDAVKEVGISTAELTEWMKPSNIKAQKRILIFDACNSGQAINDIAGNDLAVRDDSKAQQIKAIDKLNEKSGLFILSASASNQSAYEMGRYSQGLLTYSLLKAIKQKPDILNDGKYLDISKWFNAAKESVSDLAKESGARQEPQIVTNTNFNIGLVDGEVMAKIILPQEKPLFASSNFQNNDDAVADDDLELSKLINLQLADISSRGSESKIVYITTTNSPDAYSLTGRYILKGNDITLTVNIKQNKTILSKFVQKGTKDKINELAAAVAEKAVGMVK